MNPIPPDEQKILNPIRSGCRMLELGNKKNKKGVYKDYFKSKGIEHISIDWNGKNGAIPLDLRIHHDHFYPGGKWHQYFDIISNMGTTEHIIPQGSLWSNLLNSLRVGGILAGATPCPGEWKWHQKNNGLFITKDFLTYLAEHNHLEIKK